MGEQVYNYCCLIHLIKSYKWYIELPGGKTQPVVVEMSTVVFPQLEVELSKYESNIPTDICSSE